MDDYGFAPESPYFSNYIEDGELYHPDYSEELNQEKNRCDGDLDDWDRLMSVSEVLSDFTLHGQGQGKQIVGTMAVMLDTNEEYGFKVHFWRLDDDEDLPDGWGE